MDRRKLIETLEVVSRALERNNVLPIFEYLCFTGKIVYAFQDAFGIVASCEVKQPFAVQGPRFIDLLKASKSDEIKMNIKKDQVLITGKGTEYNLPIKQPDEFVWQEPSIGGEELDIEVVKGIECCLATCSDDLALEAFARICLGKSAVYSTDGDALTKYSIPGLEQDTCLSKAFCDAAVKTGGGKLTVGNEWVCSSFEGYKVYGRNLGPTTFDYETNMSKILGGVKLELSEIPNKFDEALTRARVVADVETAPTSLIIEDNRLILSTETPFGEVFDDMDVKHQNIEVKVSAALLQTSMAGCNQFKILKNCCIFQGDKIRRLVSNL